MNLNYKVGILGYKETLFKIMLHTKTISVKRQIKTLQSQVLVKREEPVFHVGYLHFICIIRI